MVGVEIVAVECMGRRSFWGKVIYEERGRLWNSGRRKTGYSGNVVTMDNLLGVCSFSKCE